MIIVTDMMVAAYQLSSAENATLYKDSIVPLLGEVGLLQLS